MSAINYNEQRKADMRDNILKAAKTYFVEHGISGGAQMKEIAAAANTSRQTLYSYYKNIDEIIFELAHKSFGAMFDYIHEEYNAASTPLSAVKSIARAILSFGIERQSDAVYIYLFDAYKHNNPRAELLNAYESIFNAESPLKQLLFECAKSGEIRPDLDVDFATSVLVNILFALSTRLSIVDTSRSTMLCKGFEGFCTEIEYMLTGYLKA